MQRQIKGGEAKNKTKPKKIIANKYHKTSQHKTKCTAKHKKSELKNNQ